MPRRANANPDTPRWAGWTDDRLLALRFRDLGLKLDHCPDLLADLDKLNQELAHRGIKRFRPNAWLSSEWFSPDGIPGIALPFYLAHPRLVKLEKIAQMLEVEGGPPTPTHAHPPTRSGTRRVQRLPAPPAQGLPRVVRLRHRALPRHLQARPRVARASSPTSTRGTPRPTRPRTSPRPSPSGSPPPPAASPGGGPTPAGRRCASSNTSTSSMRRGRRHRTARQAPAGPSSRSTSSTRDPAR